MPSGLDVGRRRVELQAGVCLANAESRVGANDICEVSQYLASEVTWPAIVGPELGLETLPWDYRGLPQVAHPVSEPHIEVDGEGRSFEMVEGSQVDRYSSTRDLCEETLTQRDPGMPC